MSTPHRFWRLRVSSTVGNSYVQIAEVSFRGPGLQDLSVGGVAAASSEYSSGYAASMAFDKTPSTSWCTVAGQFPGWVAYDHVVPVDVQAVQVTWDSNGSYLPTSEGAVSAAWSDDGVVWSTPIALGLASGGFVAGTTAVFALLAPKPRIFVSAPSPSRVLSAAYTGPYGHAVTAPQTAHAGNYKTSLLGKGVGTVYGTTEIDGTPDAPLRARVRLIRERDGLVYRETWSAAITGAYRFDNVDELETYTVLSYHPTRDRRAVVADNLIPEVMT